MLLFTSVNFSVRKTPSCEKCNEKKQSNPIKTEKYYETHMNTHVHVNVSEKI